jgi:ribonucleoside-diphosphate reductase alpha chain
LDEDIKQDIVKRVISNGSCQGVMDLPAPMRNVFVVSADISAEEHILTQAALQRFVDNSLSKTINFPAGTIEEDVAKAFIMAWKLGCKGITVYITGSRESVVLETNATKQSKEAPVAPGSAAEAIKIYGEDETTPRLWKDSKKPRPRILHGYTYSIETPLGKAFVTINENGGNQPFEVFINTAKAGSETAAHSEALGRLISYNLRIASPVEPRQRLKIVMEQLAGIGGGRSLGFGPNRVRSLPDGIAKALDEYLYQQHWEKEAPTYAAPEAQPEAFALQDQFPLPSDGPKAHPIGELCPECGQATLINEEGCRKCYTCGHSEC